jgi:hypothetical protein
MCTDIRGSCSLCLTDWSVMRAPNRLVITRWISCGPECSPLDPIWRVHVRASDLKGETVGIAHEPRSVRRLYGKAPELQYIYRRLETYWAADEVADE